MVQIKNLVRENIKKLVPYSSARDDFAGDASVFMDANENPFDTNIQIGFLKDSESVMVSNRVYYEIGKTSLAKLNRYPDPLQHELKDKIARVKSVSSENIFLGNGSDEIIDLLVRTFCEPGKDEVILLPPTYGMYRVVANIHNINIKEVLLTKEFQPDTSRISEVINPRSKLLFICSPNNPTGNAISYEIIKEILGTFPGIVVVDEAYIDFSEDKSVLPLLEKFSNLLVMHTLSKAWGLAGIRLGIGFAGHEIIEILNRIKMPYNVNELTQRIALKSLEQSMKKQAQVLTILDEKEKLIYELEKSNQVEYIYPSDANFILIKVKNAKMLYDFLIDNKIVVRDRSDMPLCEQCLRVSVGTPQENKKLIESVKSF
ncbi:Histidinol-phosphate aminotransferase [subsurface metagenome]|nr:histidinol-phosphate transaminase [Bacteroidota bacterium]